MTDLAIQIVNYKTKEFLEPLVESVLTDLADCGLTYEINIIDNKSGDDLTDLEAMWRDCQVHITYSHKNGGFGAGHNILARNTAAQYVLLLNPDMLFIEPNTIKRLVDQLHSEKATIVGPRLLSPRKPKNKKLRELTKKDLEQQPWDHCEHDRGIGGYHEHNELMEVGWVSGAVFLIDRQKLLDIGGFDEKFFLYFEEVDLCRRLRKQGAKVIYDPSICVLHYGHAVASPDKYMLRSFLYYQYKRLTG